MAHYIVFINGASGSGKDTAVKFAQCSFGPKRVFNVSSIDCVRELLCIALDDKRPETRRVLAVVGQELETYNSFRSRTTADTLMDLVNTAVDNTSSRFYFVHVREAAMRLKITDFMRRYNRVHERPLCFHNLLVVRPDAQGETNNASDLEATNADPAFYDSVLLNDGSLNRLKCNIVNLLFALEKLHAPVNPSA